MNQVNCLDCGATLHPTDTFCSKCGRSRSASTMRGDGLKKATRQLLGTLDRWYQRFSADLVATDRQIRDRTRVIAVIGVVILVAMLTGGGFARFIGLIGLIVLLLMPFSGSLRRTI